MEMNFFKNNFILKLVLDKRNSSKIFFLLIIKGVIIFRIQDYIYSYKALYYMLEAKDLSILMR